MSAPPHADPGRGVFETMLVLAGRPVELDAHLARLDTSLTALYDTGLPDATRGAILDCAGGIAHGKLRVALAPRRGDFLPREVTKSPPLRLRVDAEEIDPAIVFPGVEGGISLRSLTAPGGLGEHKWVDRRFLERAEATFSGRQLALLRDSDGSVLEASRASVFCASEGRLATPPTDGRILPSIARQQAIAVAREAGVEVDERPLGLGDLHAGEVFLTGSVRGVEPVVAVDGTPLHPPGEISGLVAAGLERRWLPVLPAGSVAAGAGGRRADPPGR